jgi:hypothetical protein
MNYSSTSYFFWCAAFFIMLVVCGLFFVTDYHLTHRGMMAFMAGMNLLGVIDSGKKALKYRKQERNESANIPNP